MSKRPLLRNRLFVGGQHKVAKDKAHGCDTCRLRRLPENKQQSYEKCNTRRRRSNILEERKYRINELRRYGDNIIIFSIWLSLDVARERIGESARERICVCVWVYGDHLSRFIMRDKNTINWNKNGPVILCTRHHIIQFSRSHSFIFSHLIQLDAALCVRVCSLFAVVITGCRNVIYSNSI